jgi:hypothetical protein
MFAAVWRTALGALAVVAFAGCVHAGQGSSAEADDGSCYGACGHYLECKGDRRQSSRDTCLSECREIFVQDGTTDHDSLRDFENLECEAAVAFVDGDASAKTSAVAGSQ